MPFGCWTVHRAGSKAEWELLLWQSLGGAMMLRSGEAVSGDLMVISTWLWNEFSQLPSDHGQREKFFILTQSEKDFGGVIFYSHSHHMLSQSPSLTCHCQLPAFLTCPVPPQVIGVPFCMAVLFIVPEFSLLKRQTAGGLCVPSGENSSHTAAVWGRVRPKPNELGA